jgi:hypothetical protein
MTKHYCGTELREATRSEIFGSFTSERKKRELASGDYGKIWVCDRCKVLVYCN